MTKNKQINFKHKFTIYMATLLLLGLFITLPANAKEDTPIYKNGSIIWQSPVGTLSLILGDPNTGGWFNFPYLYTCSRDHILVWDFLEGYPQLIYQYYEPTAKDIVGYKNFLLVQVKDGINIYQMDTATSFITYGGIFLPCDNGTLLWGISSITPTIPTVHVACPNNQIYALHNWDFHPTKHFKAVDHPIPIPPMIWGNVQKLFRKKILVSTSLPLFIDITNGVCETPHYFVVQDKSISTIHSKKPPYKAVFQSTGTPICSANDTVVIYQRRHKNYLLNVWSMGITSSISLPDAPLSIVGSYDHFAITTTNAIYLVSTIPQYVIKSIKTQEPLYISECQNTLCLHTKQKKKTTIWLGIMGDKYFPFLPSISEKIYSNRYVIDNQFNLTPTLSTATIVIHSKKGTHIFKHYGHFFLPGTIIPHRAISINYPNNELWWTSKKKIYSCSMAPTTIHMKNELSNDIMRLHSIWCIDKVDEYNVSQGIPLYIVAIALLLVVAIINYIKKPKQPRKQLRKSKKHKTYKRTPRKKNRKIWRYTS